MYPAARETVRIGVIGAGSVSQQMHLHYLSELADRFRVIGVCDASPRLAGLGADRVRAALATSDHHELLARSPAAVLIAVNGPSDQLVHDALAAGAHVFVEKPMAWSVDRGAAIEAAAARADRVVLIGYMKRYDPCFGLAARATANMGPVRGGVVRCVAGPNERYIEDVASIERADDAPNAIRERWNALIGERLDEAIGKVPGELAQAFRLVLGITCHELSVLRGLLGAPREIAAARVWDDGSWLSATLRYDSFSLDYLLGRMTTRIFDERFELYSEREALELSFPSPFLKHAPASLTRRRDEPCRSVTECSIVSHQEAFRSELEHFHACVLGEALPRTAAWEGRADAEVMTAIIRAANEARPQTLVQQQSRPACEATGARANAGQR